MGLRCRVRLLTADCTFCCASILVVGSCVSLNDWLGRLGVAVDGGGSGATSVPGRLFVFVDALNAADPGRMSELQPSAVRLPESCS